MPMTLEYIPTELIQNFKDGIGSYFVGAGLSTKAGYPSWSKLLTELIEQSKKKAWIKEDRIREFEELAKNGSKFLFLAEELKIELGSEYQNYLEERFSSKAHEPTEDHNYIVQTNSNLIITINYDDLLERAYNNIYGTYPNSFTYSEPRSAANNFWKNNFFILKAHGDAKKDVEGLILSQRDYRRTLYREPGYRSILQSMFTTKSIVFVGVSLRDPEFNQLLDYLHDSYHGGGPKHYILLDEKENMEVLERRYLDDFNIQVIPFENQQEDYQEVTDFLELVSEEAPANREE